MMLAVVNGNGHRVRGPAAKLAGWTLAATSAAWAIKLPGTFVSLSMTTSAAVVGLNPVNPRCCRKRPG